MDFFYIIFYDVYIIENIDKYFCYRNSNFGFVSYDIYLLLVVYKVLIIDFGFLNDYFIVFGFKIVIGFLFM